MLKTFRSLWSGKQRRHDPECYSLDVYDEFIDLQSPDGEHMQLDMTDLRSVAIRTDRTTPMRPNYCWYLEGNNKTMVVPTGATGETALVEQLQKLPGFDNEQVMLASSSTRDGVFLCWLRDQSGDDETLRLIV
jgi:hypothetical protein